MSRRDRLTGWTAVACGVAGAALMLFLRGMPSESVPMEDAAPSRPISLKAVAAPQAVSAPAMPEPAVAEEQPAPPPAEPELHLTLDHTLSPSVASKPPARQ